jgi:hypothetical protein
VEEEEREKWMVISQATDRSDDRGRGKLCKGNGEKDKRES